MQWVVFNTRVTSPPVQGVPADQEHRARQRERADPGAPRLGACPWAAAPACHHTVGHLRAAPLQTCNSLDLCCALRRLASTPHTTSNKPKKRWAYVCSTLACPAAPRCHGVHQCLVPHHRHLLPAGAGQPDGLHVVEHGGRGGAGVQLGGTHTCVAAACSLCCGLLASLCLLFVHAGLGSAGQPPAAHQQLAKGCWPFFHWVLPACREQGV